MAVAWADQFSVITDVRHQTGPVEVVRVQPQPSHLTQSQLTPSGGRMVASRSKQAHQITPHKRRGPIAAEFSSPGPASIALPGLFGSKNNVKIKSLIDATDINFCKRFGRLTEDLEKLTRRIVVTPFIIQYNYPHLLH